MYTIHGDLLLSSTLPNYGEVIARFESAIRGENGKRDFPLANAHFGLARCYLGMRDFPKAMEYIDLCFGLRRELYPNENHEKRATAEELKRQIEEQSLS